ncbi:MAG TPA: HU family DNA-binding protein [Blastocatellia bacterium]|jgi:integration host factor subunit beta|nr:HU family DNA-binding protein [Blastocatellia bacterium]
MTKAELVEEVARAAELNKRDAEVIVETVFDSIIGALHKGEKVELRGFGSFRTRERGPRRGRNPKTGEPVDVPAKRVPYFKPGKELKDFFTDSPDGGAAGGKDDGLARAAGAEPSAHGSGDVPPGPYAVDSTPDPSSREESADSGSAPASPAPNERSSGAFSAPDDSAPAESSDESDAGNGGAGSDSKGGEGSSSGSGY